MDILTTGLAIIVILALPFVLWLKYEVHKNQKRELDEIKTLATQRSQWLEELHSRFDALEKQEAQHESAATENAGLRKFQMQERLIAFREAAERDVVLEKYSAILKALDLETSKDVHLHNNEAYRLYYLWSEEAKTVPDWLKDAKLNKPAGPEALHRKSEFRSANRKLLQGPTPQAL
jgi:replicative superfamily II helicase